MATWGEFIKEFKITNMKGTVYIHADQVLDVWEERNNLRKELEQVRGGSTTFDASQVAAAVAEERERCAFDVLEFAEACAAEPDQPEYVSIVLRAAAELIRGRGQIPMAEEPPQETEVEAAEAILAASIPPPAEEIPVGEAVPSAEPVEPESMQE